MRGNIAEDAAQVFFGVPAQILREIEDFARERGVAGDGCFLPRVRVGREHAQRDAGRESKARIRSGGGGRVRDFAGIQNGQRDGERNEFEARAFAGERTHALARPRRAFEQVVECGRRRRREGKTRAGARLLVGRPGHAIKPGKL